MAFFDNKLKLKLARSFFTRSHPFYIQYYITARCNQHCEQCNILYAQADSPEMNIHQIRQAAKNLAKIGVCIVLLIGGEPFMRQDLPEIIEAFVENNIHVRMQTNGLATKEMLKKCIVAGGHDISISLDSLNPSVQGIINGGFPKSWERIMETVANINKLFPEDGKAFFGTVLMPRNMEHIKDVVEFATAIGWGVSLVPVHTTTPDRPLGFRTFDDTGVCRFTKSSHKRLKEILQELKELRRQGFNLYDSDEYLDDIYRFIIGQPLQWRRRNSNICDSPNLYFAIEPDGNIQPCCDYKLDKSFSVFVKDFPKKFKSGEIHKEIFKYTSKCDGCLYGSYPEITITARFLKPFLKRLFLFTSRNCTLRKMTKEQMIKLAQKIYLKNSQRRKKSCRK